MNPRIGPVSDSEPRPGKNDTVMTQRRSTRGRAKLLLLWNILFLLLAGSPGLECPAANLSTEISEGESMEAVRDKLGKPAGMFQRGSRTMYLYDRGMIQFEDGKVIRSDLVTPEEAKRLQIERERAEAERILREAQEHQRLEKEGAGERQRMKADEAFKQLPAAQRLERWKAFTQKYPYTPVQDEITRAESESGSQDRLKERDQKMTELKTRIQEIEARLKQLDADYAASLANWKRTEIDAERAKLTQEYLATQSRMVDLLGAGAADGK